MQDRLRTVLPSQFGLFELFVLTTVAAIAFALFRLPYPYHIRLFLLMMLWIGFQVFIAKTSPHGPTRQVRMAVIGGAGSLIQIGPPCIDLFFSRGHMPLWLQASFALFFLFVLVLQVALVTWQVRTALRTELESANSEARASQVE